MQYVSNLNNKTFKHFFKIFKLDTPEEINEIVEKIPNKQLIIVTRLPTPDLYSFNFIKDVHHIHMAIQLWNNSEKVEYNKYVSDIKNISVQKFINVYDKKNRYDDKIEDKLFDMMITLIDRKVNGTPENTKSEKFRRMPQDGGKVVLFGQRQNM
jgi:hypothetical protein